MLPYRYAFRRILSAGLLIALFGAGPRDAGAQEPATDISETAPATIEEPAPFAEPTTVLAQKSQREGRLALKNGQTESARRHFQEAIRLDPTFSDPHFSLAGSWLPFRPGAAGSAFMDGIHAQWSTFRGQHRLVMNLGLAFLAILSASLIATAVLVTVKALRHFQHPVHEVIRKRIPGGPAALAAWIIVIQPVLWGMGLYLTIALALGCLWVYLNAGEKRIIGAFLVLAAVVPFGFHTLSRLAAPFNPESIPYLLSAATETPGQPGLREALGRIATSEPTNPEPHLALGLIAEHHGDMPAAEAEYLRALELGGSQSRVRNNLGNVYQQTGRIEQSVTEYQKAIAEEPDLAAPHFNLSQAYARRLQFDLVDQEMRKASDLDFEGVRAAMSGRNSGTRKLLSLGAAPAELWEATFASRAGVQVGLPRSLAWLYDGSMTLLPMFTIALFVAGLFIGGRLHHFLPTYNCANCGNVVCRKCLRRIRRRAYCVSCGETILSLKTSEFTRMLLDRRLRDETLFARAMHFFFILIIPGWEAIRRGRPTVGLILVTLFSAVTVPVILRGMPVKAVPALVDVPGGNLWLYLLTGLVVLYGLSALILKSLPEPESALMEAELGIMPDRSMKMDRAA
jgi:tetratricopeptide (TPR) repeat protein